MKTINLTIKLQEEQIQNFESWLGNLIKVVDFKILPDTDELYNNDKTFRLLDKAYRNARRDKEVYINKHN